MRQKRGKQVKPRSEGDPQQDNTPAYAETGVPVVVVYKSKKGKKRGSSRAARRLEDIESRVSKSANRVTKAVNKGVSTYRDKRDKSARKRRDGALVDSLENLSRGASKAVKDASPALTDVAKALNTRRLRKRIRKTLRGTPVIG